MIRIILNPYIYLLLESMFDCMLVLSELESGDMFAVAFVHSMCIFAATLHNCRL